MYKLIVNKIRCKFCGDIIESRGVHNFVRCRCGKCSTDGGREYAQRSFFTDNPEDTYEDMSVYVNTETNEIVPAADANKEDIPFKPIRIEIKKVKVPDEPKVIEAKAEPLPVENTDETLGLDEPEKPFFNPPKWGKSKYATKDGKLTEEGKKRYFDQKTEE